MFSRTLPRWSARVLRRADVTPAASVDVVVVGSGAAACNAALAAAYGGASVMLLEKMTNVPTKGGTIGWGGTTAKSGGTFWVPNNPCMKDAGEADAREPTINIMARRSYPDKYDPKSPTLGLNELEYGHITQYFDKGTQVLQKMRDHGVMPLDQPKFHNGSKMYDYYHSDDNPALQGRMVACGLGNVLKRSIWGWNALTYRFFASMRRILPFPMKDFLFLQEFNLDITYGIGFFLSNYQKSALKKAKVDIQMGHSVEGVVVDDKDQVVGVRVEAKDGEKIIEAKKGVIFGSGGFDHNPELVKKYMPHRPIDGTCASTGNTGILVSVAEELKCDLTGMDKVYGGQCYVESSMKSFEQQSSIFMMRGDGFFVVDRNGNRVMNEKTAYDTRVRQHWRDGNRFLIIIADKRAVDLYGMEFAKTLPASPKDSLYIRGSSVADLAANLKDRVAQVAGAKGVEYELDENFASGLEAQIQRFNGFAETGKDLEFSRGETNSEKQWTYKHSDKDNHTMHPLDPSDLFAVILGTATLGTKGGPQIDLDSRCLRDGKPVEGLYAAGNCIAASVCGDAYWSGGATIGIALTSGWIAGEHAAARQV